MSRARIVIITLLSAWTLLLLVTHRGARSPYSYISHVLNPKPVADRLSASDGLTVIGVTRFFYDGSRTDWSQAHNMRLPFHSFAVAAFGSFVRSYPTANDITNFVFAVLLIVAGVRTAERLGIRPRAIVLSFATLLALPSFVAYLGQPMHYIVGPAINFLVLLIALALPENDLRNPWIAGALTAILTLNYDWYVFAPALATYVVAVLRFERKRDDLIYVVVAAGPLVIWTAFLRAVSGGAVSTAVRELFIESVIVEWAQFFSDPARRILQPFIAAHIGVHIGLHEIIALIHWPLILCCAIGLWRSGPTSFAGARLLILLAVLFLLEQIVTAAYDWENNPRRALPILFVFAWLYSRVVDRHLGNRKWEAAFLLLFALTAFLALADVVLRKPGAGFLHLGEAVRWEPKFALRFIPTDLVIVGTIDPTHTVLSESLPKARLDLAGAFAFAQCFVAFWLVVLFSLLKRAGLAPRYAPHVFVTVWLLSAVRFL